MPMPANNEETILQQIAQYESSLDEMIKKLDSHDQLAKEIDSSDVSAWPTKYDAWLGHR
jgi:prephenate dehydrogenase